MTDAELERQRLKENPTPELWLRHLHRLFRGEFDRPALDHLGSAEQFVRTLLSNSARAGDAATTFLAALETVVLQVELHPLTSPREVSRLMELVAAFKPRGGLLPLADMLRRADQGRRVVSFDDRDIDFREYALAIFETYFPIPAPHVAEFEVYVDLLREHLAIPAYAGYALVRLLDLKILSLSSDVAGDLFRTHPDTASVVIAYYLQARHVLRAAEALGQVYAHMRHAHLPEFVDAVRNAGGTVETLLEAPRVVYGERVIHLRFSDRSLLAMHQTVGVFDAEISRRIGRSPSGKERRHGGKPEPHDC